MGYCTLSELNTNVLQEHNIKPNDFANTLNVIADIVNPNNDTVVDGVELFSGDNPEVISTIANFLSNNYHKSFLEFISKNKYLSNYLKDAYSVADQNSDSHWEAYVKALYSLKEEWDKYANEKNKANRILGKVLNANSFLLNSLKETYSDGKNAGKYKFIKSDELDAAVEAVDNTDYTSIINTLINDLTSSKDNYPRIKSYLQKYFHINLSEAPLDLPLSNFKAKITEEINRAKSFNKKFINNQKALNGIIEEIKNCNREYSDALKRNDEARKKKVMEIRESLKRKLNQIGYSELEKTLNSQIVQKGDDVYDYIKERLLALWATNEQNKIARNEEESSKQREKEIFNSTYNNFFFPWYKSNVIPEAEWNKLKSKIGDGISIKDLVNSYFKTDSNKLLSEFLKGVSSKSNPVVKILSYDSIPEGKLKKQIDAHLKNHGHIPAGIYASKAANKELGESGEAIYIIDDGTNEHSFSLSALTHEWIHALTTSSMYLTEGMQNSIKVVLEHCKTQFLGNKTLLKGLDTTKLNMVQFGSKQIPYAFTSESELLAEVFNNTELQKLLQRIKSPFKEKNKQSLLDWFLEKIRTFINNLCKSVGARITDHTALTELLVTGGTAIHLTLNNDSSLREQLSNDTDYGTYLKPEYLSDFNDYASSVITRVNMEDSEVELIRGCNNIITPSRTTNPNEEKQFLLYKPNAEYISTYNEGELVTGDTEFINNKNYSNNTIAALYIKNDVYNYGTKDAANAITNAINAATTILNLGGRVVTYSKEYLEDNLFDNQANINIYQALLNSGYTPHSLGNRVVWTQDKLSKEDSEQYLLDAEKVNKLNPSIENKNGKCIIRPDVTISEQLKNASVGTFTLKIKNDNPLYEQLLMVNNNTLLQIHNNALYFGNVTALTQKGSTLQITFDLHISEFSDLNTKEFDSELFESTKSFNVSESSNLALKIGLKKAKYRTDMVARDMVEKVRILSDNVKIPENSGIEDTEQNRLEILFNTTKYGDLCQELKSDYERYINDENYRLNREKTLVSIENDMFDAGWSDETITDIARERIQKKVAAFKEMLPYFDSLIKAATKNVASTLGLRITYYTKYVNPQEKEDSQKTTNQENKQENGELSQNVEVDNYDNDFQDVDYEDNDPEVENYDDSDELADDEAVGKDHWQVSSANQDIHDTVNKKIRKILSKVLKSDSDNNLVRDDLGNIVYENEREVFNNLLQVTADMQNIDEMLSAIEEFAANGHENYYTIVDTIIDNEELKSLFFVGLCNQRKNIESVLAIGKDRFVKHHNRDSKYEWVEKGVLNSIAQKEAGTVNSINHKVIAEKLQKDIVKLQVNKIVSDKKVDGLQELLKAVGINLSKDDIKRSIRAKSAEEYNSILEEIKKIADYCINNENSLASTSYYYKELAKKLSDSIPIAQQSMTYCEGKLYPSYNKQSFISREFSKLNSFKTVEDRRKYMDKAYKQYSQYYTKNNLLDMIDEAKKLKLDNLASYLENLTKYNDIDIKEEIKHIEDTELLNQLNSLSTSFRAGFWNYKWLSDIYASNSLDLPFSLADMISFEGTSYEKMTEKEYLSTMFAKFKGKGKKIAVTVPIYADANCWNFMYCDAVNSENQIISAFEKLMMSEIERVKSVRLRDDNRVKAIKDYNKKLLSLRGKINSATNAKEKESLNIELKSLNVRDMKGFTYPITNFDVEREIVYKSDGTIDETRLNKIKKAKGLQYQFFDYKSDSTKSMKEQIKEQLDARYNDFVSYVKSIFLVTSKDGTVSYPKMPDDQFLRKFYLEHSYATANILGMTSQPFFYKDAVDFQKRFKEVYALTTRLNINAEGGKKWQRGIVLSDRILDNYKSEYIKVVGENIDNILKQCKHLTAATKSYIKKQFSSVNATDAQAIRTPSSYIAIMTMLGEWGDEAKSAWSKITAGKVDIESLRTLTSIIKPFCRSSYTVSSGTNYGDLKVPIQYKNSEFMSPYGSHHKPYTQTATDTVLAALTDFMEDNFIDVANFESAVKVGNSACIDLNNCKSYFDTMNTLYQATGLKKLTAEERQALEKNIQNETEDEPYVWYDPQIIKTTSFKDWGIVAPNPEHFTDKRAKIGSQIRRIFQSGIIPNEMYEFQEVSYEYNKKTFELKKVVKTVKKKGSDLLKEYHQSIKDNTSLSYKAIEDLANDKDKLAMFLDEAITNDDKISDDVKALLQRDDNGNFVNMADPTGTESIHQILMSKYRKTVTEQKIAGGTCVQVSCMWDDSLTLHWKTDSEGNTVIDYADVYLPCYMKTLYQHCLNDNKILDIEVLRQKCAARNDMKTFDALTNMIGYRCPTEEVSSCIPIRVKGFLHPSAGSCVMLPKEITTLSGSDFDVDKLYIMRHEFSIDKDGFPHVITDNSVKGNNNKLLDMMLGMMSTSQFTERFINPSGAFSDLEKAVDIMSILDGTVDSNKVDINNLRNLDPDSVAEFKSKLNLKSNNNSVSLLSPKFQPYYHEQNFLGKNFLATWAVIKSASDLLQNCNISLKTPIIYNNKVLYTVAPMFVNDGNTKVYLTQIIKQFLAASADNTKNPVQHKLGITRDNIAAVTFMTLMGLDAISIALILRASKMSLKKPETISKSDVKPFLSKLSDANLAYPTADYCDAAAYFLNEAKKTGTYLTSLISILREDSQKGALKKDIYETLEFKLKIERLLGRLSKSPISINGDTPLIDFTSPISSKVQTESQVGFVQQFFDYGVRSYWENNRDVFPEFTNPFEFMYRVAGGNTKRGYLNAASAKDLTKQFYYYKVLGLQFFGDEEINGELVTAKDKIESYKKNIPSYFRKFISEHTDLLDNEFIKRLQLRFNPRNSELEELTFPNAFRYEKEVANSIKNEFLSLFQDNNPEIRQFAWNLVKYSFYRQGFYNKGDGYGHFIDRSILTAIPGYTDLMQNIQKGDINIDNFVDQFILQKSNYTKQLPTIYSLDLSDETEEESAKEKEKGGENKPNKVTKLQKAIYDWVQENIREDDTVSYVVYKDTLYEIAKLATLDFSKKVENIGIPITENNGFISYNYNGNNYSSKGEVNSNMQFQSNEGAANKGWFEGRNDELIC